MAALIARAKVSKARGDTELEVWGNPDTVRDLLYVEDQIEAIIAADQGFDNCILNVTSNAPVTIGQCAREILHALDWTAKIVSPTDSFQGAGFKSLDSSRFLAATGWAPRFSIERGVRALITSESS